MDYLSYAQKLDYLKWLVERKMTGCPKSLAGKLNVSPRTARRMVSKLREMGGDIQYCRQNNSYFIQK